MKSIKSAFLFLILALSLAAAPEKNAKKAGHPNAGAEQTTPSRSMYFTWVNNTNEGTTEQQTRTNLAFFQWLHDEFDMTLDIYAFDAGFVDSKEFSAIMSQSDRFKRQFPNGLGGLVQTAAQMGTRFGHWSGPDGFGNTPEQEQDRIDMMAGLCRDYHWALYKFDAVSGELRPEKEQAFNRMMKESRKHSPDLIALNHRLPLGPEGLALMTTNLWDGEETYVDVHFGNKTTAPHHRAGVMSRSNTPKFDRLLEDHGVCFSSCLDNFDDDMILQVFARNLILAPEVYGNPWFLRDDELPKFARIFNLTRRYRDILVNAIELPEANYGPLAVSRGNEKTRLLSLRNLTWEPVTYTISAGQEIGLAPGKKVELRQFHPTEKILGSFRFGEKCLVTVPPFRACLLLATTVECSEIGVAGCDYEVIRDKADKPALVRLLGMPGTPATVSLLPGGRHFSSASLSGQQIAEFTKGKPVAVTFDGTPITQPWHRQLSTLTPADFPNDAEALYEATCFAADNNALEVRSLLRAGDTKIPVVQAARDAFFNQHVFVGRGLWDRYLFDGDPSTSFYVTQRFRTPLRVTDDAPLRIDFGELIQPDSVELIIPDQYSLNDLVEGEGGSVAQVSADLKNWTSIPFIHGEMNRIVVPKGAAFRYLRIPGFSARISEVNAYSKNQALPRGKWRASNLFGSFAQMNFVKAWTGTVRVDEQVKDSRFCVALNGRHGIENAYAALRTPDGRYIGAADRATSFPCNPWESTVCKLDSNYTYYFPITPEMVGKNLEVVVLGGAKAKNNLRIEVWQTAHATPFSEKLLQLE